MYKKIYNFMGLATKAGKMLSGEFACENVARNKTVYLIIVAEDAADNTKKKFIDICNHRGIEIRIFGEKQDIGRFTGKDVRAVAAIIEKGFAMKLIEMIDGMGIQNGGVQFGKV